MENTENAGRGWRKIRENEEPRPGDEINLAGYDGEEWMPVINQVSWRSLRTESSKIVRKHIRRPHVSGLGDGWRYLAATDRLVHGDRIRRDGQIEWSRVRRSACFLARCTGYLYARRIEQPEPEKQYRFLKAGEVIREGDEVSCGLVGWCPTQAIGLSIVSELIGRYRRPLTAPEPINLVPTEKAREAIKGRERSAAYVDELPRMTRLERMAAGLEVDIYKQHRENRWMVEISDGLVAMDIPNPRERPQLTIYGPDLSEP